MSIVNEKLDEGDSKDIYLLLLYQRKQKEKTDGVIFPKSNILLKNIYVNETKEENGMYSYNKVLKFKNKIKDENHNNASNYSIEFDIGRDNYKAGFVVKDNSFVYDVELKKRRKILTNISEETIDQNIKDYMSKLNIFINALKKNNEEEKIDKLYKETIEMYSKKGGFDFLVELFILVYKKKTILPFINGKIQNYEYSNESK